MSPSEKPWRGRRMHFVGVGGAGMSGYARAAHALGAEVSGSDAARTTYLERLELDGVLEASLGHRAENLPQGEGVEVVYSSAVSEENVERRLARERGGERSRADLLAELTTLRRTIAVAGTHGKTTTASMLVHALRGGGIEPGWLIGAPIGGGLANAEWGQGEWLVVEADESDRSMLSLSVEIALLTNVELDHHAEFASLSELRTAFQEFLAAPPKAVIWDRPELLELRATGSLNPYSASELTLTRGGSRFDWHGHEVALAVPGAHNAANAAGALEAAVLAGADIAGAIGALSGFHGAGRRFQLLGSSPAGALVYDDYAHHPTEVAATLQAARTMKPRRLVAVFQPHLYSRTALLAREFGRALALADEVAVLDVYPARERAEDHPGVSGLMIAETSADAAAGRPVYWLPSIATARPVLAGLLEDGDLCVVMGAGDIDALGRELVAR
jgi:UDP-N-acetylmuramate--alanine ligase